MYVCIPYSSHLIYSRLCIGSAHGAEDGSIRADRFVASTTYRLQRPASLATPLIAGFTWTATIRMHGPSL